MPECCSKQQNLLLQGLETGMVETRDLPWPGRGDGRGHIGRYKAIALSTPSYWNRSEVHI